MPFDAARNQWATAGPIANVTGTADSTFSANEVTLINDLVARLNAALQALRDAGIIAS